MSHTNPGQLQLSVLSWIVLPFDVARRRPALTGSLRKPDSFD